MTVVVSAATDRRTCMRSGPGAIRLETVYATTLQTPLAPSRRRITQYGAGPSRFARCISQNANAATGVLRWGSHAPRCVPPDARFIQRLSARPTWAVAPAGVVTNERRLRRGTVDGRWRALP